VTTPAQVRPRRRRKPPRPVEVVSVGQITPRLVSVELGGEGLSGFQLEGPTQHIKVFLPAAGQDAPTIPVATDDGFDYPEDAPRPIVRTYTPRRFNTETGTLEVQFVLHGDGPASDWAQQAKAGDKVAVGGPGGRFQLDLDAHRWWIAGDESAIPAIATLLEALPSSATADVHLEVGQASDEVNLKTPAKATITWHRRSEPDAWGEVLLEAAEHASIGKQTQVWVACEAAAVRRIRQHFLSERGLDPSSVMTRGYWRLGAANHPDHDYGDGDPASV
jgi:NADPH-dependent ferric siderophore reductase